MDVHISRLLRPAGAGGPAEVGLLEEMAVLKAKIAALEGGAPATVPGQPLTTSTFSPTYSMSSPTSIIESVPDYDAVAVVRNTSGGTDLAPDGAD